MTGLRSVKIVNKVQAAPFPSPSVSHDICSLFSPCDSRLLLSFVNRLGKSKSVDAGTKAKTTMLLERLWTRGQPRAPGGFEVAARVDAKPPVSFLGGGDGSGSGALRSESCIMSIPGFVRLSLRSI